MNLPGTTSAPSDPPAPARVAAIDCGTNSIRILITERNSDGSLRELDRQMRIVRLGEGVDTTGELSEAALRRTFAAAEEYAQLIKRYQVSRVRCVATSATRDARNRHLFVQGFTRIIGVAPEVISGTEEAELSFRGAISALRADAQEPVLVVDLGGGSTEFVLGASASGVTQAQSVDMGCVRFTERYVSALPVPEPEREAVSEEVQLVLSDIDVDLESVRTVVGVAGTITTVTAFALGLDRYQPEVINGAELSVEQVSGACDALCEMSQSELAAIPVIHPGRVDVISTGALIWKGIIRTLSEQTGNYVQTITTSEHDILDGIALSLFDGRP